MERTVTNSSEREGRLEQGLGRGRNAGRSDCLHLLHVLSGADAGVGCQDLAADVLRYNLPLRAASELNSDWRFSKPELDKERWLRVHNEKADMRRRR